MKSKVIYACLFGLISIKTFSQGNFEKITSFQYFDCENLLVDGFGNIFLGGQNNFGHILISRLDSAGNFVWSREISEPTSLQFVGDMMLMNDSLLVIIGASDWGAFSNGRQLIVAGLDIDGNIKFLNSVGDTSSMDLFTPFKILQISRGTFAAFSNYQNNMNGEFYSLFDTTGNLISGKIVDLMTCKDVVLLADNSYLSINLFTNALAHFDSAFTNVIIEDFLFVNSSEIFSPSKFVYSNNGELYVVGEGVFNGIISHVNSALKIDSAYLFKDTLFNIHNILDVQQLSTGHWIAFGVYQYHFQYQFFLMELDENFNPLDAIQTTDSCYFNPFISYDLGKGNSDRVYWASTRQDMLPIGLDTHVYSSGIPLSAGCNYTNQLLTLERDSCALAFQTTYNTIDYLPVTGQLNLVVTPVSFSMNECLVNSISNSADPDPEFFYPNPATNYIKLLSDFQFTIYDELGRVVSSGFEVQGGQVDLSDFKSGIYFILLDNGNSIRNFKLLVSKTN